MGSSGRDAAKTAAVVAGAALAAGLAYSHLSKKANGAVPLLARAHISTVIFADGGGDAAALGRTVRHPRGAPVGDLIAAAGALFGLENPRLFLESTREELLPTADSQDALQAASCGGARLVILIVTPGAPLSAAAAALPPLQPPPYGPRPLPFVGNALCFAGPYEPPMYNVWHHVFAPGKYGDTVRLVLPVRGLDPSAGGKFGTPAAAGGWDDLVAREETIFTSDPEVAAELLARQEDFPKTFNRPPQARLQEFASNGIFTCDTFDPDWADAHGLLPRFFNAIKVQGFFPQVLEKTRSFMREWNKIAVDAGPDGALVPKINDWFACMTADAVVKCAMGTDMHNVERKGANEALHPFIRVFRQGIMAALGQADLKEELGMAYYCPFINKRAAMDRLMHEARKEAEDMVFDFVEKTRRGEIGEGGVIAAMLNDKAPNTGNYVRVQAMYGHIINLMVAGHETTATTLAWTLYYLCRNPECEAKALQEIKEVLGSAAEPSPEHIPKLVYIEACFREALRLHPAVTAVARDSAADTVIKGKWLVRRGQRVNINLVALHRREDQWGGPFGDPNAFNPDRFLPGANEKAGLPPRHPQAYLPWGFGVRSCVGQLFALWEAKTFLAMLLPRFKLRLPAGYVAVASNREGGATPNPYALAFHVHARPNAPPVPEGALPGAKAAAPAKALAAGGAAAPAVAGHGTPLAVLFGSNSGMCEDFAQQLAVKARASGFAVTVSSLDAAVAASPSSLPTTGAVAVVACTYNGFPPDNAAAFAKWLDAAAAGSNAGVKFAVFGAGNSQWAATYQAFPTRIDAGLAKAGAAAVVPLTTVDVDKTGAAETFDEWADGLVGALLSTFQVDAPEGAAAAAAAPPKPRVKIAPVAPGDTPEVDHFVESRPTVTASDIAMFSAYVEKQLGPGAATSWYRPLEVLASTELLPPDSSRRTRHVELALPPGMDYSAGDHLEVLPINCRALVSAALQALGLSGEERFVWTAGSKEGPARGWSAMASAGASLKALGDAMLGMRLSISAAMALAYMADLAAPPSQKLIARLAAECPCPPEAAALAKLATPEGYAAGIAGPKLTLVELLQQHRSVKFTLPELLNALPRLAPRYYSISSSPLADPRRCSITVGLVTYTSPSGRAHRGAASGLIHTQPLGQHLVGTVRCLQSKFKLPKDPATPIIMVGPGTGLAPMMGFMQERDALIKAAKKGSPGLGPALLFFGCRSADEDYIYRERLEGYLGCGVLTGLHVAFSRDGPSKVYVQDLIQQAGAQVWSLLEAGAVVYICGDARRMAPDVKKAFTAVAREHGGRSEASAQNWMGALMEAGRYLEDVWAG